MFLLAQRQESPLGSELKTVLTDPGQKCFSMMAASNSFSAPTLLTPQFSNAQTTSIWQSLLKHLSPAARTQLPTTAKPTTRSLSQSCLTQSCSTASETFLEQKLPLPCSISTMQICLKTTVSSHLSRNIPPLGSGTQTAPGHAEVTYYRYASTAVATSTAGAPEAAGATGAFWGWPVGTEIRDSCQRHRTGGWHHQDMFLTPRKNNSRSYKETKTWIPKSPKASWKSRCRKALEDNTSEESSGNCLLFSSQGPLFSLHTRAAECVPHSQAQVLTSCCLTLLGLLWCSELEEFISLAWDRLIEAKERG